MRSRRQPQQGKGRNMGKDEAKKWWELSTFVPAGRLDVVLWALCGAVLLFLVLMIVSLVTAGSEEVDEAVAREADSWQAAIQKEQAARKAAEDKTQELRAELSAAGKEKASLEKDVKRLEREKTTADGQIESLKRDIEDLRGKYKETSGHLERLKRDTQQLGEDAQVVVKLRQQIEDLEAVVKQKDEAIGGLQEEARKAAVEQARLEGEVKRLGGDLKKKDAAISQKDEHISELKEDLADAKHPSLSEEDAAVEYQRLLDQLKTATDQDERIELCSKTESRVVGTSYEDLAHRLWRREVGVKQRGIDAAAYDVYMKAKGQVWANPKSYAENIKCLRETLEKVRGSRYESEVQSMLDRQMETQRRAAAGE